MEPQTPITVSDPPAPPAPRADGHWITIASMAVFVLLSLAAVAFLYYQNQQLKTILSTYQSQTPTSLPTSISTETPVATSSAKPSSSPKACTQEAKLCPNGSYVGRTGPNCEFTPCP